MKGYRKRLVRWLRQRFPLVLFAFIVVLLGWYLAYTAGIARSLRANAETLTEIFAEVQELIEDPDPEALDEAYFRLLRIVIATGVPLVLTGPGDTIGTTGDTILGAENLPFEADLNTPEGQERIRAYVRVLEARSQPVGDPTRNHVHYGDLPELRRLRWIPWLQAGGLFLAVLVGFTVVRYQRRSESEQAWTAMARELAHQLGTPISSLQGWLEVLRLPSDERPGDVGDREIARGILEDLRRLERVSHRFELIGRDPVLKPISVRRVVRDLERYLKLRLPRFGAGVALVVDVPEELPDVQGHEVLLAWALENMVKNAVDALAGKGGRIEISARELEAGWVGVKVIDDGTGVAFDVRDTLFDPGVTTKDHGWGVGLALSRRIIEGVHGGRLELLDGRPGGATFQVRLPIAQPVEGGES